MRPVKHNILGFAAALLKCLQLLLKTPLARVGIIVLVVGVPLAVIVWYGNQPKTKEIRGDIFPAAVISDVWTPKTLDAQWSSPITAIHAGEHPLRVTLCPATAAGSIPKMAERMSISGSASSQFNARLRGEFVYFDDQTLEVFQWEDTRDPGWIEIDIAEGANVEFAGRTEYESDTDISTRCVSVQLAGPESGGRVLRAEFSGGLSLVPLKLSEFTLKDATGQLFIGADPHPVHRNLLVDLKGDFNLAASNGWLGISGDATRIEFNGDEQLPPKWGFVRSIPQEAVTALITAVIAGIIGVAVGYYLRPTGSSR
jgi:hypothetical protein